MNIVEKTWRGLQSNKPLYTVITLGFVCILGILAGFLSTNILISLLISGTVVLLLLILLIFFRKGTFSLDNIIVPLLVAAVLLPPIRLTRSIPDIRVEPILILIALALFLTGRLATGRPFKLRWNPTNKWFFLFGICILVSIANAAFVHGYYPIDRDFWELGKLIEYFLIFALVASLNIPPEHMRKYYVTSLVIFMCSAAFGFAQYFNLLDINSWLIPYYAPTQIGGLVRGGRIVGTTGNPNEFGALMVLAASLALTGALWLKGRSIKLFSWAALGVFSLAIVFTLSRSSLLCLLVAVAFIALYKYTMHFGFKKLVRMVVSVAPVLLIIAFIVLQLAPDLFFLSMGSGINLDTDASWQARLTNWEDDIALWQQSPLLGWGPGKETISSIVDNEWLLLLRRYGLLGVVVFILWFVSVYRTLSRIGRETRNNYTETFCTSLQATLIAYAIFMIPAGVYHSLQLMPILLIFLGLAYTQRQSLQAVQLK